MGGAVSSAYVRKDLETVSTAVTTTEISAKVVGDQTPEELRFKSLLGNGVFIQYMVMFSKVHNNLYLMKIWEIIEEYEAITANSVTLLESLCIILFPRQELFPMAAEFIQMCDDKENKCHVQGRTVLLHQIKECSFKQIYEQIYLPFCKTSEHKAMCDYFDDPSTWITYKSFQYLNLLAQGGYGVVVQVRKIRTKQVFAMKIQSKLQLLRQFRQDKSRVTSELAAGTVFNHPYVAGIAYAFQTETLAMIVLPLSACGDLRRSLSLCPNSRMSLDRVTFYAAEISSALMYMHMHEIMYRDLKPGNVLLNADGHIMLADFGSLAGISLLCYLCFFLKYMMVTDSNNEIKSTFRKNAIEDVDAK